MKTRTFTFIAILAAICFSVTANAQTDLQHLKGKSTSYISSVIGGSTRVEHFENEYTSVINEYYDITTNDSNGRINAACILGDKICIVSDYIPGGVKVGDNISKLRDVDFTKMEVLPGTFCGNRKEVFNEKDNLRIKKDPIQVEYLLNYDLFRSKNGTYSLAVENDIIKMIVYNAW